MSQSAFNTRPLMRGRINENDHISTMMILRIIELQRAELEKSWMLLCLGEYSLKIRFKIRTTKVDKKMREFYYGFGKTFSCKYLHLIINSLLAGSTTYPCFLCKSSTEEMKSDEKIKEGFKMDRVNEDDSNMAELMR